MTSTTDLIDSAIWSLSLDDKIKVWELIEQLVKESQLPQQDTEKEMFELEQQLDIPSHMRWHNRELPQQEISDEQIEKWAKEQSKIEPTGAEEFGRIMGAKWYREQIKQPKKD